MIKSTEECMKFVKATVHTYLQNKRHLWQYREDMEQEGMLAVFKAEAEYDPKLSSVDSDLYLYYQIKQRVIDFARAQTKHFGTPEVQEDSGYWNLDPPCKPDELRHPQLPIDRIRLRDLTSKVDMTMREQEILNKYLEIGDYSGVAALLGNSKQHVRQVMGRIVERCKELR